MKRALDLALSIIGLVIATPIMLIIAILLKIDSPGEIFFSQKRLGKGGRIFRIHKFRKFPQDWGVKGAGVTTQNDVRMTSFGAFLERTKLDELPQLWNILKGEMSFVGPRPESLRYQALFTGEFSKLLDYTPGIFGPNQVAFRNEALMYPNNENPEEFYKRELFPKKALSDIAYFEKSTFSSDLAWIFKGVLGTLYGTIHWRKFFAQHALIIIFDLILLQAAWFVAHVFRFGFPLEGKYAIPYETGCWLLPLIIMPAMYLFGCYRHPVRYFGVPDLARMLVTVSSVWAFAALIEIYFFHRFMSIGVSALGLVLFLTSMTALRTIRREHWLRKSFVSNGDISGSSERVVLVYGANKKGHATAKFLEGFEHISVVGFLDNDEALMGRFLNGRKVFGHWRDIDTIKIRVEFTEIWLCCDLEENEARIVKDWGVHNEVKTVSLTDIVGK